MTQWFTKKPGEAPSAPDGDGVMVFIGDLPDWVRTPPELGGSRVKVLGGTMAACPKCPAMVPHLHLEGELYVAECRSHGFLWYRKRAAQTPTQ